MYLGAQRQKCNLSTVDHALTLRCKNGRLHNFKAHLLGLPSYRRFPSDEEYRREFQIHNLYKFNKGCSYRLRWLEKHQHKESIAVADYMIEHILPQNPDLSTTWHEALGPDWIQVQEEWLHRLGNFTLTGYNPELSDRPFLQNRSHPEVGLRINPLLLNQGLGQLKRWDVAAMLKREGTLASWASGVWASPPLSEEQRHNYRLPSRREAASYTLNVHR